MMMRLLLVLGWICQVSATTIHRGNGAEPETLNIHLAQGLNSHNILMDVYEGLMTFDANGQVVYGVAESHQVNADKTIWQFSLRPEAKWSDGREVVAQDFIRAWQQAIDPQTAAPYRQLFEPMLHAGRLRVESAHPKHLSVRLNHPNALFINQLVLPVFYPLPSGGSDPTVVNGAFQIHQRKPYEYIELIKNPYFHAAETVQVDAVRHWVTENQTAELLRFRAGELDITETIPDQEIDWIKQNLGAELRVAPYYGSFFLGLNLADPKLSDLALRQALNAAIDRDILVDKVLKSGQLPAHALIPGHSATSTFDLERAQQALKASRFQVKSDRIELRYNNSSNQKKVALAVAAMWRQNLGIKTRLVHQEWKAFVISRQGPNKQVFRGGWIADYPDPLNFLQLFHSQSHFNYYGFKSTAYDQALAEMAVSTDSNQRLQLQQQAENLLQQTVPFIPLYQYVSRHLVNAQISGFEDNLMDKHLSRYLSK